MRPSNPRWHRLTILSLGAMVFACSDAGGGGCGGCGGGEEGAPPYEFAGSVEEHVVHQAGQVHVTQGGLDRLTDNLEPLIGAALGGEGLSFCLGEQDVSVLTICGDSECDDGTTGCQLEAELRDVSIVPRRTTDPASDAIEISLAVVLEEALSTSFGCDLTLSTGAAGMPVSATITLGIDAPPWERMNIDFSGENLEFDLDSLAIGASGGFGCGALSGALTLVSGPVKNLLTDQIAGPIDDAIGPALCTSCSTDLDCSEAASCSEDGICVVDGTDTCEPLALGVEMAFDIGDLLADFAPGLEAELGILAYAANFADAMGPPGSGLAYEGVDIGLQLGFFSEANACVPYVPAPPTARVAKSPNIFTDLTPNGDDFMIGIGIARTALNLAGWAAFRSGALCISVGSDTISQISTGTFSLLIPSLGDLVGGANAPMQMALRPQLPPVIELGLGTVTESGEIDDPLLTLVLPSLEIDFYVYTENRYVRLMTLDTDIEVPLALDVNADNQIEILLGDLSQAISRIETINAELLTEEDAAGVATALPALISSLLPTLLGDAIAPIDIPELLEGMTLVIPPGGITSVDGGQMLAIYADLEFGAPAPKGRPLVPTIASTFVDRASFLQVENMISEARHLGRPLDIGLLTPDVVLDMDVFDPSNTHDEFEYSYRVNGTLWSMWQRGPQVHVSQPIMALGGEFEVDVKTRAIGDSTSISPVWASTTVVIDYHAPTLLLEREGLLARVEATDSQSVVSVTARVNGGDWFEVAEDGTFDLTPWAGRSVVVEVDALDAAGNRSADRKTFNLDAFTPAGTFERSAVDPGQAGCNASRTAPNGVPLMLFGLAALMFIRRKSALVATACLALTLGACGNDKNSTTVSPCDPKCAEGLVCEDGACVESNACEVDDDCANGVCNDQVCSPECTENTDCAGGEICADGACTPVEDVCEIDDDCASGEYCDAGECIAHECVEDSECGGCDGADTPRCVDNSCACEIPCPEGCADGEACCNGSSTCIEVSAQCEDQDCDPGYVLTAISDPTYNSDTCEAVVACECQEMPPLQLGFTGVDLDLGISPDGNHRAVAAYNETYEDLMVGVIAPDNSIDWQYVDGVPDTGAITGSLNGPRGGISTRGDDVGRYASIAVSDNGDLHVAYYARNGDTPKSLRYAHGVLGESGYEWNHYAVDETPFAGTYTDIELTPDGLPAIGYGVAGLRDEDAGTYSNEVRYVVAATAAPASVDDWAAPATIVAGVIDLPCGQTCVGSQDCRMDLNVCQSPERASACDADCGDGGCFENEDGTNVCAPVAPSPEGVSVLYQGIGIFLDMEFVPGDSIGFAYYDHTHGNLVYAVTPAATPGIGNTAIVAGQADGEDTGDMGWYPDLFVAADDTIYIGFGDATNGALSIANLTDNTISPVDTGVRCYESSPDDGSLCVRPLVLRVGYDAALSEDESGLFAIYQDATWLEVLESPLGIHGWELPGTVQSGGDPYTGAYGFYLGHGVSAEGRFAVSYRLNQRATPPQRDVVVIPL